MQNDEYATLKEEFEVYYNENLRPILKKNEWRRYYYLSAFVILLILGGAFYPYILQNIWQGTALGNGVDAGYLLAASGFVVMIFGAPLLLYKSKVKPQIMPAFAKFFGTFSYIYQGQIAQNILQASHLFKPYNNLSGDDFFVGEYSDVKMIIAEQKMTKPDFRGNPIKVFSGICVLLEMNKNFKGETVVLQDRGILNSLYKIPHLENVRLEDSKFEKIFEVYSDSQIEARYLLTTAFMERILKLRDLFGGRSIQFSFKENTLLIAIDTRQNMFEAHSFFRSNINKKKIDRVFEQFYTVFSIIKILKLNQRIGM